MHDMVCPSEDGHPSQYQSTDSAAGGIELTTIESQSDALTIDYLATEERVYVCSCVNTACRVYSGGTVSNGRAMS